MADDGTLLRVIALVIFGIVGVVLPLSAAIREARKPKDSAPLDIDSRYRKDDRYFANSFDDLLTKAIGPSPRPWGIRSVRLRENESVQTTAGSFMLHCSDVQDRIYDIGGDLDVEDGSRLPKEVLVAGSARIGNNVQLRALKAGGDVTLGTGVEIERWIDAGGRLTAGDRSRLGARATSLEEIVLGSDVSFRLLSAPRIVTAAVDSAPAVADGAREPQPVVEFAEPGRFHVRGDGAILVKGDFLLPAAMSASGDVVARGSIRIGCSARLRGSLHSDGDMIIGEGALIEGSVYSEGDLCVEHAATIVEHAVTAGSAMLRSHAHIGVPGRITTLLADGPVELEPGAMVCGRIVAAHQSVTRSRPENLTPTLAK
jgi:cytoskeletal protein CcmA (bactofilin family)